MVNNKAIGAMWPLRSDVREIALWPDWQQCHGMGLSPSEHTTLDIIMLRRQCRTVIDRLVNFQASPINGT